MNDTTVSFTGNLAGDPETRVTATGKQVTTLRVAVSHRRQDSAGHWVEATPTFHRVEAWGDYATTTAESLRKGDRVVVLGRLSTDSYDRDGETRYATKVTADVVAVDLRWVIVAIEKVRRPGREDQAASCDPAPAAAWAS